MLIDLPLKGPLCLTCRFHYKNHQHEQDLSNALQGIEDILEELEIIENDSQIYSLDGSRKLFDSAHDFVEISLKYLDT